MSLDRIYSGVGWKRTPLMVELKVVLSLNSFQQVQYGQFFCLCHSELYPFLLFTHRRNSLKFIQILPVLLATFSLGLFFNVP